MEDVVKSLKRLCKAHRYYLWAFKFSREFRGLDVAKSGFRRHKVPKSVENIAEKIV